MSANAMWMMGLAVMVGAILPMQALINARLGTQIGGPLAAAFVSFLVGTLVLGAYLAISRQRIDFGATAGMPAWAWLGGFGGAVYVAIVTLAAPRLGAASLMCLVIFGQVIAALVLDRFGVMQDAPRTVDVVRMIGAVLVLAGVVLVAAPWRSSPPSSNKNAPSQASH